MMPYSEVKRRYVFGVKTLEREIPFCERDVIVQYVFGLDELVAPLLMNPSEAEALFNSNKTKIIGMAHELLEFGAEQGNPNYALLGAKLYEKCGKGRRPFILNAIRRSLDNMVVNREKVTNNLDLIGPGFTISEKFCDRIANGYRISKEEAEKARKYLDEKSIRKSFSL